MGINFLKLLKMKFAVIALLAIAARAEDEAEGGEEAADPIALGEACVDAKSACAEEGCCAEAQATEDGQPLEDVKPKNMCVPKGETYENDEGTFNVKCLVAEGASKLVAGLSAAA